MTLTTLKIGYRSLFRAPDGQEGGATASDPEPTTDAQPTGEPGDKTKDAPPPASEGNSPDYSWAPEGYQTDEGFDGKKLREDFDALTEFKKAQDERLAEVPEDATGYEFAIPEDLDLSDIKDLPEGFKLEPLIQDEAFKPLFEQLGATLHEMGAPKGAAGKLMGLIGRYEATKTARLVGEGHAELAKLENSQARIEKVHRALETKLPEAEAKALSDANISADTQRALEKILSLGTFGASQSEPPAAQEYDPAKARYPNS